MHVIYTIFLLNRLKMGRDKATNQLKDYEKKNNVRFVILQKIFCIKTSNISSKSTYCISWVGMQLFLN